MKRLGSVPRVQILTLACLCGLEHASFFLVCRVSNRPHGLLNGLNETSLGGACHTVSGQQVLAAVSTLALFLRGFTLTLGLANSSSWSLEAEDSPWLIRAPQGAHSLSFTEAGVASSWRAGLGVTSVC